MTQNYRYLLRECLWDEVTRKYLVGQILCYGMLLASDILLVNWYENFYDSIIKSGWTEFVEQVMIFCAIASFQAIALGLIANLSELMDVSIKVKLVKLKLSKWVACKNGDSDVLEQRLIEDSLLISDKLSGLTPSVVFSILKIMVFSALLLMHNDDLLIFDFEIRSGYILLIGFVLTASAQIFFANKGRFVIEKTENIKRRGEFEFRRSIRTSIHHENFNRLKDRYVKLIKSVRKISAKKIGSITFLINISNSISFVVPFVILFQLYEQNISTLGGIMKIAAIYSALSNSAIQIFNTYGEVFKLSAAIKRLLHD